MNLITSYLRILVICSICTVGVIIALLYFDDASLGETNINLKVYSKEVLRQNVMLLMHNISDNDPIEYYEQKDIFYNDIEYPIILWWTPFTLEPGTARECGLGKCWFTNNRSYIVHPLTKVLMFYASNMDFGDLPLPRKRNHEWALLHEESPKNSYYFSHEEIMTLFNHTATFRRESDFPLTMLHVNNITSLESKEYLVSTAYKNKLLAEGLALVNYVQSDCDAPSDRDHFVRMMMKYIPVDSYGQCLNNKQLPLHIQDPLAGMSHPDFIRLQAQYKFSLALENGVCNDYMTEKLWRPLEAGSIPIVFGSPRVRDYLPNNKSAIIVDDFRSMRDLVNFILHLNQSDDEYESFLTHKRSHGITNDLLKQGINSKKWSSNIYGEDFVSKFECFVCDRVHSNMNRKQRSEPEQQFTAKVDHYGCPQPKIFSGKWPHDLERVDDEGWGMEWIHTKYQAQVLLQFLQQHHFNFTSEDLFTEADKILHLHNKEL